MSIWQRKFSKLFFRKEVLITIKNKAVQHTVTLGGVQFCLLNNDMDTNKMDYIFQLHPYFKPY